MAKRAAPLLIAVVSWAFQGCQDNVTGRVCTLIAVPALTVTVVDGAAGQRICDAAVVAVDGSFRTTLERHATGETCGYSGPYERPGVYEVQVTREGYQPAFEMNLRVTADECHVSTRQLTVTLARQ